MDGDRLDHNALSSDPAPYRAPIVDARSRSPTFVAAPTDCKLTTQGPLYPKIAVHSMGEVDLSVEKLSSSLLLDPSAVIRGSAEGDAASSIALFNAASECVSKRRVGAGTVAAPNERVATSESICTSLPSEIIEHRLIILLKAAEKGSADAQLVYALNAIEIARKSRRINTAESLIYADTIVRNSERFGRAASEAGLVEAYEFMSRSYLIGSFGIRDTLQAYAYALPLGRIRSDTASLKQIQYLGSQLTAEQRAAAGKIAFGCESASPQNVLANPFG